MGYVYILQSEKNGKFYIGSTSNVIKRFEKHRRGEVRFTKGILPVKLVFKQKFDQIDLARKIEKKLKSLKRRDYLEKIIKDGRVRMKLE